MNDTSQRTERGVPRLMIVGLGDLGFRVLGRVLTRDFPVHVAVTGRDLEVTTRKARLQQLTAFQRGRWVEIEPFEVDVEDIDRAAEAIACFRPDVIFNAMSRQSWRIITELPRAVFAELDTAELGPWLPMHLVPMQRLMRAVERSGVPGVRTVNAAYPDAVNPALAAGGLAPTTGIGNVANIVPALRCASARLLGAANPTETQVLFYAQHFLTHGIPRTGTSGGAPFHLRVLHEGQDATGRLDPQDIFREVATTFRRQGGQLGQELTSSSALAVLEAMLTDADRVVHAPGPGGRPGGWAVRARAGAVTPVIPEGVTEAALRAVNEGGQARDGVERIDADGTVWFTEANMAVMERLVGWSVRKVHLDDMAAAADELDARYRRFAQRHGAPR